jgi:hypothetical protein
MCELFLVRTFDNQYPAATATATATDEGRVETYGTVWLGAWW